MSDLVERSKEVQLRGNTHSRNVFLLQEMREYIRTLENKLRIRHKSKTKRNRS